VAVSAVPPGCGGDDVWRAPSTLAVSVEGSGSMRWRGASIAVADAVLRGTQVRVDRSNRSICWGAVREYFREEPQAGKITTAKRGIQRRVFMVRPLKPKSQHLTRTDWRCQTRRSEVLRSGDITRWVRHSASPPEAPITHPNSTND